MPIEKQIIELKGRAGAFIVNSGFNDGQGMEFEFRYSCLANITNEIVNRVKTKIFPVLEQYAYKK